MQAKKLKIVYVVSRSGSRARQNRVGIAFENSDGSLSVKLEAFPLHGELLICNYTPLTTTTPLEQESYPLSA